jgi:pimeloyl-ACP methyl ester carboxylesterase
VLQISHEFSPQIRDKYEKKAWMMTTTLTMRPFSVRTADGAFVLQCYDFVVENAIRSSCRRPPQHNVLLLHCNGINCLAYKAVVEQLVKRNVRVVTYDQRGHGRSRFFAPPPREGRGEGVGEDGENGKRDVDLSWKTFARDAELVLDAVREKDEREGRRGGGDAAGTSAKWHAVGHSLGGFASLWLEATEPGTFASILAYEPIFALERRAYPGMRAYAEPDGSLQRNARKRKRTFTSFEHAYESYQKGILGQVMDERSLRGYVFDGGFRKEEGSSGGGVALTCDPEIEARIYENGEEDLNALHFIEERIDTSKCPVTIATGGATKKTYAYGVGKVVAERIKGARALEFGLLGHFGPLTAPEVFADAVAQNVSHIYPSNDIVDDTNDHRALERSRL